MHTAISEPVRRLEVFTGAGRRRNLTPLGSESSPSQKLKNPLQRLRVHVPINAHATPAAKLDLDNAGPAPCAGGEDTVVARHSSSEPPQA
ncbi:hypothetical protein [Bradyrhizobium guangdongense]|uniref:hypothetical protein n=1 Tax=Bradyrhizobium guangdongense TaxID=1325090 RepID=UPI001FD4917B|nr:hypothetical protein [Bradyrhizobium guangdongense]